MNTQNPSRNLAARPYAGLFSILTLLAGWLALVTPLRADNPPTYLFQIDCTAASGVEFYAWNVALDSGNNVYVTEIPEYLSVPYIDRIEKFNGSGTYLTQWGSLGTNNGQFENPEGVAVDISNNVYVGDGNDRVQKFSGDGTYLTQWGSPGTNNGQFGFPTGIAVDSSNNVYVADQYNTRVEKFDSNGNYLTQWGSFGTGNGQFDYPTGIAVDSSNNVYVADANNHRVEKFDQQWRLSDAMGRLRKQQRPVCLPRSDIAVDSSNNVYVTDEDNYRVEKFDGNGNYLTQWGSNGSGNGQFDYPPKALRWTAMGTLFTWLMVSTTRLRFSSIMRYHPPIITSQPASQIIPGGPFQCDIYCRRLLRCAVCLSVELQ